MANIKSNEKSRWQDDKRNFENKSLKSQIKTAIKKAKADKTRNSVDHATKLINSAITKGVFQENKAARLVSKIQSIEVLDVFMKKSSGKVGGEEVAVVETKDTTTKTPTTAAKKTAGRPKGATAAKKPAAKPKTTTAAKKPAAKPKTTTAAKKPAAKSTTAKKPAVKKEEPK